MAVNMVTEKEENETETGYKKTFYSEFGKRFLDVLLSGTALLMLSPLLLILVLLVRIMHGTPVFFTPTRPGRDEKIFKLYKFRTMSNALDREGRLLPEKERLTKLGKFLRATSLDEIPELFNIFDGDMSIVGPRPFAMKYLPYYSETERARHSVRPGLTGLAQISGRNNLPWPQRFEKDFEYIRSISFFNDISIILGTAKKLLGDSNVTVPGVKKFYQFDTYRVIEEEGTVPQRIEGLSYPELGGQFWAEPAAGAPGKAKDAGNTTDTDWLPTVEDSTFTLSGRAAITLALRDAGKKKRIKKAYVPSHISFSMLQSFIQENIEYRFYDVAFQQGAVSYKIDKSYASDIFFVVDYFGTDNSSLKEYADLYHQRGCVVVEDITHNLLNPKTGCENADYYVASLRKWFPVPAGGWLGKGKGAISNKPCIESESAVAKIKTAMEEKHQYINGQMKDKISFLEKMSGFESDLVQLDPMLQIDSASREYLQKVDIAAVKAKRKANAQVLYNKLSCIKGIDFLNTEIQIKENVPLFLPVLLAHKKRNALREKLMEKGIYCPVHWLETMGAAPGIRGNELSLICDQRYSPEDMAILADEICAIINRD